ncbi:MAG: cytochrome c [Acidobacteria bacterium]|nr:cytochrome c [Acidobacteriota bacterium]
MSTRPVRPRGKGSAWILAFVAFSGIGLGVLLAVGCAVGANECPFRPGPPSAGDARGIWLRSCAACHGVTGKGTRSGPSLISGKFAALTVPELEEGIARGKPLSGMPAFRRSMSPEEIAAVAAYVLGLRPGGPTASPTSSPPPGGPRP